MLRAETPQEQFNLIGAGRRNWIINGSFQVSQRGDYTSATNYINATYYLDRWKSGASGGWTSQHKLNQTLPNGSLTNTYRITSTGGGYAAIDQYIEDYSIFSDQLVTFSFWAKTNFSGCSANFYTIATQFDVLDGIVADEEWHYYTVTKKVPSGGSAFRVEIWTGVGTTSGDYLEIAQVQLELGKVATPFEHRSYGEELALCQRYYQVLCEGANQLIGNGDYYATTQANGVIRLPVEMRATPSIEQATGTNYYYAWSNGGNAAFNSFTLGTLANTKRAVELRNGSAINITTAGAGVRFSGNSSASFLALKAEL
jgi:hypothetical protein